VAGSTRPVTHGHIDFSHLNVCGTFYHIGSIIDGYSRYVVHSEIRATMFTSDAEIVVQRAREKFPGETPRIISDNGPQFVAKDFKQFLRLCGMTHVTTSPYYPQSNGKKERWFGTLKRECIRPNTPLSLEEARRLVARFVEHYNQRRGPCPLHDAPSDQHRSFSVHLGKGVFRCFHPDCHAQGNTLDLWAAYHRLPIGQAAESLANTFAPYLTSPQKSGGHSRGKR